MLDLLRGTCKDVRIMDTSFRIAVNRDLERTAWGWVW
jgi:hypothetical protein